MKPVEIEFLMKDNLTAGLDKGRAAVERLLSIARGAAAELEKQIRMQQKLVDGLYGQLGKLEAGIKGVDKGSDQWNALGESIRLCREELGDANTKLKQLQTTHSQAASGVDELERAFASLSDEALEASEAQVMLKDSQNEGTTSTARLSRQLAAMDNTLTRMRLNGEENTEEYRRLSQEAAGLADTLGDVREQTRILADDNANLKGFASGVQGLAGAFTAATGVMSLFASENENLAKVQTRLQGVMAITMGLQQAYDTLNKDSAFRLVTVAKAKDLLTAANGRLAVALGISTAAATALMAVLTVGLSLVVTGLIVAWNKYSEAQEKAAAKTKEFVDALQSAGREYGENRVRLSKLKEEWDGLTSDDSKRKWIEENREEFEKLDVAIDDVGDAENVFVRNTDVVIESMKLRAKAAAYAALATQKYQEALVRKEESKARRNNPTAGDYFWGIMEVGWDYDFAGSIDRQANVAANRLHSEAVVAEREAGEYLELEKELLAEAEALREKAGIMNVRPQGDAGPKDKGPRPGTGSGWGEGGSARGLQRLRRENEQSEIDLMKEGSERRIRQLRLNYEKELAELDRLEKEWREGQRGGLSKEQTDALDMARRLAKSKLEAGEAEIAEEERAGRKAQLQSMRQYLKEYGDALEQELAITEEYQEQIAEARAKGDEGKALLLERKLEEELSNKRLSNLRNSPEYIRAFEDLGKGSSKTLQSLIKKFEDAKEAAGKSLDPQQLREYTETLQQMYDELDNRNPFEALTKALKDLADAQKEVKDAQDIYNKVKGGHTVINASTGSAYTESEASRLLASAKDNESKAYFRLIKASTACAERLHQFADTLAQLGEMVGGKLGDSLGALGSILGSVGGAFENIKNINVNATGFEKARGQFSAVAGTVSAMVDMNRQLDRLLPDANSLYEHYAAKQRELNEQRMRMIELEIAQLEERLTSESWFYENGLTQLKKNAELNAQYAKAYGKVAMMPQEIYRNASSGFSKWAPAIFGAIVGIIGGVLTFGAGSGPGAALGAAIGSAVGGTAIGAALGSTVVAAIGTAIFSGVGAALGNAVRAGIDGLTYEEGQTAAINNMRVQTRHETFFRSEKTQDLQSWVKENWGQDLFEDVNGVPLIDPEVAKKLLENGPTLVGETRATLEKLLEYSEKIREFLDEVHEYVSEAFSPLVDNLTDALWDWLSTGEDVMDKFREYAADTFKKIAQDALKAMIAKTVFEPFQEQLENLTIAYATGQIDETAYMAGVSEYAKQAQSSIEAQLPVLQNAAQVMVMAMKGAGIDIVGDEPEVQSGRAGAFTAMSQDQAGKLEGLFVSGQMHWASMDDRLEDVASRMSSVQDHLRQIATNTGSSAQSLVEIKEDIKKMIRDGLKVK